MSFFGIPEDLPIQIRNLKPEDYGFILASWSNEAHHVKYDNFISNSIFFPRQKALINNILKQSIVKIAHVDDNPDIICGYIVIQPRFDMNTLFIHWAQVKPIYRRKGICKALIKNYLEDANPILVVTSPFTLLPSFKEKNGLIYDPTSIDSLRGRSE